jgi:hypothetical protein
MNNAHHAKEQGFIPEWQKEMDSLSFAGVAQPGSVSEN